MQRSPQPTARHPSRMQRSPRPTALLRTSIPAQMRLREETRTLRPQARIARRPQTTALRPPRTRPRGQTQPRRETQVRATMLSPIPVRSASRAEGPGSQRRMPARPTATSWTSLVTHRAAQPLVAQSPARAASVPRSARRQGANGTLSRRPSGAQSPGAKPSDEARAAFDDTAP